MKTLVIAGTYDEANNWMKRDVMRRWNAGETSSTMSDYIYCNNADRIKGMKDPHGVFIGTWRQRKDMEDIFVTLLSSITITNNAHRVVNQLWGEWNENRR